MKRVLFILVVIAALGVYSVDAQSACCLKGPGSQIDDPYFMDSYFFPSFFFAFSSSGLASDFPVPHPVKLDCGFWDENYYGDPAKTKRTKKVAKRKKRNDAGTGK
ncbi:MAG: hypothetical protein ABIF77_13980 [bacterium]